MDDPIIIALTANGTLLLLMAASHLVIHHKLTRMAEQDARVQKTEQEALARGIAQGYAAGHLEGRVQGIRETKEGQ